MVTTGRCNRPRSRRPVPPPPRMTSTPFSSSSRATGRAFSMEARRISIPMPRPWAYSRTASAMARELETKAKRKECSDMRPPGAAVPATTQGEKGVPRRIAACKIRRMRHSRKRKPAPPGAGFRRAAVPGQETEAASPSGNGVARRRAARRATEQRPPHSGA